MRFCFLFCLALALSILPRAWAWDPAGDGAGRALRAGDGPAGTSAGSSAVAPWDEIETLRRSFHDVVYQRTIARLEARKKQLKTPRSVAAIESKIQRLDQNNTQYIEQCSLDLLRLAQNAGIERRKILYFLYIDRSKDRQLALAGFFDPERRRILPVGLDLISTGDMNKGKDHFLTPEGVFENTVENFGYRALGTPNQDGWLGLGARGSRVWDFGFQPALRIYHGSPALAEMRLLVHATDPVQGEVRLGRVDSKGCVRVSAGLNEFLDRWALLDGNYEEWAKTRERTWLLRQDRTPVATPGRFLFIGDTSDGPAPASAPGQSAATGVPGATARTLN